MKTLDEKAFEYSERLSNQCGTYTKGEIETAYVTGAAEAGELKFGELGTFGQAYASTQRGRLVARKEWGNKCYIVKQINSDIAPNIVPKMQSLPYAAKKKVQECADGAIHYREQCLIIFPDKEHGSVATNYVPDWLDISATDWYIVE